MHRFYKRFIEPRSRDEDTRNRELVLNVLTMGTIFAFASGTLVLVCILAAGLPVLARVLLMSSALAVAVIIYLLSRFGRFTIASYSLVIFYAVVALADIYRWGATVPTGLLLLGLVVVLSGILLGAKRVPAVILLVVLTAEVIRNLQERGIIKPDLQNWINDPLDMGQLFGCSVILIIMGTVSWIYVSQMERSLKRARRAEQALLRQKDALETAVEQRTRELQSVQLERVQQMYRFAELGQLSTALLHDLANHLTTLSLDIEGLQDQHRSQMLQRAKRSIRYIDNMVGQVRDQLHGRAQSRPFNIATEMDEILGILNHRAQTAGVRLAWQAPADKAGKKSLRINGEPIRFRQLIANLVTNGIDAYPPKSDDNDSPREVLITATPAPTDKSIIMTIEDWGHGVADADRGKLFDPFFSTKKTGMGMGLFIAKQVAEEHFNGSLTLDEKKRHTSFVVTLARE